MKMSIRLHILLTVVSAIVLIGSNSFAGEGHDAGYEWAARHGITDTGYNRGNSNSFNEGVRQYAAEHQ